jgi:ankyrin repeat protein
LVEGLEMSRRRAREENVDGDEEEEDELDAEEQLAVNNTLLAACKNGSVADVRRALRNGAHVNATDGEGQTGLILACMRSD